MAILQFASGAELSMPRAISFTSFLPPGPYFCNLNVIIPRAISMRRRMDISFYYYSSTLSISITSPAIILQSLSFPLHISYQYLGLLVVPSANSNR